MARTLEEWEARRFWPENFVELPGPPETSPKPRSGGRLGPRSATRGKRPLYGVTSARKEQQLRRAAKAAGIGLSVLVGACIEITARDPALFEKALARAVRRAKRRAK